MESIRLGNVDFVIFIEWCVQECPDDVDLLAFKVQNGREKQEHLNTGAVSDGGIEILVLPVLIIAAHHPASSVANPLIVCIKLLVENLFSG